MFNFKLFLEDNFESPRGLVAFTQTHGLDDLGLGTAQKWFLRGSIPSGWFALLVAYLEFERGEPVRLANYIGVTHEHTGE